MAVFGYALYLHNICSQLRVVTGRNQGGFRARTNFILFLIALTLSACGGGVDSPEDDTSPDAFSFTDQADVALSSFISSNSITVADINTAAAISVSGGEYSIDGGAFTSTAGTVSNGQSIMVRQTSSSSFSTLSDAILTIGGVADTFSVTTLAADTTPDAFSFTDQVDVALSSFISSNSITVADINTAAAISVSGGEYSIDGGAFISTAGTVSNGQSVTVRQTSSSSFSFLTDAILTIGGISDAFSVTTLAGNTPPATPVLILTPQAIKTFRFSWTDVIGETEYRLLEDATSSSGYTQVASIAANATGHDLDVSLPARINARYILQACNSGGCTDSQPEQVSGTLASAVGYLKGASTGASDSFGYAVALSSDGSTLAVGAPGEESDAIGVNNDQDNNLAPGSGAVYVFVHSGTSWVQQAFVKASNTGGSDQFGWKVALSADGNTLAVGARREDSSDTGVGVNGTNEDAVNSGAVYVYTRSGSSWSQQAYVKASNTGADDYFGGAVSLSADGNTLAVGAYQENGSEGAVYVFTRSVSIWSQQAFIKASNTEAGDQFGYALALSADANTLAVGARREDSSDTGVGVNGTNEAATLSGAVYVYIRSGSTWSQQAYVKASNTEAGDQFGDAVSLSADGNTLAVGAYREGSNATDVGGNEANNSASDSGAVYVFTRSGTTWSQQAYVKASNTGADDYFGKAVSLSADGNTLAVGAYLEDSSDIGIGVNGINNLAIDSGAAYVFIRSSDAWTQRSYVKASNTGGSDLFAQSVALSGDGNTLAVGAEAEASNGNPADNTAPYAGAAYLY